MSKMLNILKTETNIAETCNFGQLLAKFNEKLFFKSSYSSAVLKLALVYAGKLICCLWLANQ
jgi:hypothetical protein